MNFSEMTSAHFIFIPAVLLIGLVIGWVLGSRAADLLGTAISAVWHAEAYAYSWYWPLRTIGLVMLIGLVVGMYKHAFK